MNKCKECWWHGKPIECPANFDVDTHKCKNFEPKKQKKEGSVNDGNSTGPRV